MIKPIKIFGGGGVLLEDFLIVQLLPQNQKKKNERWCSLEIALIGGQNDTCFWIETG